MTGIEPVTSSLPRKRSTPELHRLIWFTGSEFKVTSQARQNFNLYLKFIFQVLERETGFEPATFSLEG